MTVGPEMNGDCEGCRQTTTEGIVVQGQLEGIYKVLAKVAGVDTDQAISRVLDLGFEAFDEVSEVVTSGATVQMPFWICGDCASATDYRVGPMGAVVYREGTAGMGEVF